MKTGCENCKHLDVSLPEPGRRAVREMRYKCTVPIPMPILPASVTKAYHFQWPPNRIWMSRGQGADCPLFEQYEKEK